MFLCHSVPKNLIQKEESASLYRNRKKISTQKNMIIQAYRCHLNNNVSIRMLKPTNLLTLLLPTSSQITPTLKN